MTITEDTTPTSTCRVCAAGLREDARFCTNCGYAVMARSRVARSRTSSTAAATWIVAIIAIIGGGVAVATMGSRPSYYSASTTAYSSSSYSYDYSTTTYATSTTVQTYAATPSTGTAATFTVSGSDNRGYSSRLTLAFDTPIKPSDAMTSSLGRALVSCSADSSTDALIPVHLTLTNTTSGFNSILGFNMSTSSYSNGDLRFESDVKYTSGNECVGGSSYNGTKVYGVQFNDPIAANAGTSSSFYLVVHNYFSPRNPSGDVAGLENTDMTISLSFGDTNGTDGRQSVKVSTSHTGSGPSVNILGS